MTRDTNLKRVPLTARFDSTFLRVRRRVRVHLDRKPNLVEPGVHVSLSDAQLQTSLEGGGATATHSER